MVIENVIDAEDKLTKAIKDASNCSKNITLNEYFDLYIKCMSKISIEQQLLNHGYVIQKKIVIGEAIQ